MRRRERQVTDPGEIRRILEQSPVVFLALHDEPAPYILPLFFGHEEGRLYVHCARTGTKLDLLARRPQVGFSAVAAHAIVEGQGPCDFTAHAESVVGTAEARVVDDQAERLHGLDLIMRHYAPDRSREGWRYRLGPLGRTNVLALEILTIIGKGIGKPAAPAPGGDPPASK